MCSHVFVFRVGHAIETLWDPRELPSLYLKSSSRSGRTFFCKLDDAHAGKITPDGVASHNAKPPAERYLIFQHEQRDYEPICFLRIGAAPRLAHSNRARDNIKYIVRHRRLRCPENTRDPLNLEALERGGVTVLSPYFNVTWSWSHARYSGFHSKINPSFSVELWDIYIYVTLYLQSSWKALI